MPLHDPHNRQEVAERYIGWLRNGVPTLGWEGDPDLELVFDHGVGQRWEVWLNAPVRGEPDRMLPVLGGPPGAELNDQLVYVLIQKLVEGDTHRKGNSELEQFDRMMEENERKERARTEAGVDATADALGRFYTEAGKTLGVTKTFFPT